MTTNLLQWLAAFAPILLLLVLMLLYKRGGDEAAPFGLLCSIVIAYLIFGGGIDMIALAVTKGMWYALSIILVVFPALLIYEVSRQSGSFTVIRQGMENFTPNKIFQILAVGWIFTGFLQGITGFGVPVAVGAPILIGMGVKPLTAVLITLLGQAWGTTFGTLGLAWEGLISQVDLANPAVMRTTVIWTTGMLGIVNLVTGFIITGFVGGYKGIRRNFIAILILSIVQGAGQMWLALRNPMLSNFAVACLAIVLVVLIGKHPYYRVPVELADLTESPMNHNETDNGMNIVQAFVPYIFFIVSAALVLLNSTVKSYFGQWQIALAFSEKMTSLGYATHSSPAYAPLIPLTHCGAFLFLAALAAFIYYCYLGYVKPSEFKHIGKNSLNKTIPSALAVIGFVSMSKVMDETGQTAVLAQGVVEVAGGAYPILSPFIGLLGTFITSSNLSSNILFGGFQQEVAMLLSVDKALILAAQSVGGAIGTIIAPSNILLGTTTAGILGQEGTVIRKLLIIVMLLSGILGITIFFFTRLG